MNTDGIIDNEFSLANPKLRHLGSLLKAEGTIRVAHMVHLWLFDGRFRQFINDETPMFKIPVDPW